VKLQVNNEVISLQNLRAKTLARVSSGFAVDLLSYLEALRR